MRLRTFLLNFGTDVSSELIKLPALATFYCAAFFVLLVEPARNVFNSNILAGFNLNYFFAEEFLFYLLFAIILAKRSNAYA